MGDVAVEGRGGDHDGNGGGFEFQKMRKEILHGQCSSDILGCIPTK